MVDTDFAWRLTQGLVRIDSSDPGAYEDEIERYIKALVEERLAQLSYPVLDAVQIAEHEVLPGRRNLMVTVPGQSDEPFGYRPLGRWLGRGHSAARSDRAQR